MTAFFSHAIQFEHNEARNIQKTENNQAENSYPVTKAQCTAVP